MFYAVNLCCVFYILSATKMTSFHWPRDVSYLTSLVWYGITNAVFFHTLNIYLHISNNVKQKNLNYLNKKIAGSEECSPNGYCL